MKDEVRAAGRDATVRGISLRTVKVAMQGMRHVQANQWLKVGPHDLTNAAKGAAVFAVRMAVLEVSVGRPDSWCGCAGVYAGGNWPFGRLSSGEVLVV